VPEALPGGPGGRGPAWRTLSDREQTAADTDQGEADLEQTASDIDQSAAERDQIASDRDQQAADRDQAATDAARGVDEPGTAGYERSRRHRAQSTLDRDSSTQARSNVARARDDAAERRDRAAAERDAVAGERDERWAALDAELERLDGREAAGRGSAVQILLGAQADPKRAAADRARAASQRQAAAADRALAARDRERAAADRIAAAAELVAEGFDLVTGALRRRAGLAAMQREMDRTARSRERLVVAFIDVDGLKTINDHEGHRAGDTRLLAVATTIQAQLRSYDVITRYGGDEFICSLADQGKDGARRRFAEISSALRRPDGLSITVGIVEREGDDSLEDLIERADAAMIAQKRRRFSRT
jgi:diguanylate cyclase (GGDEF)-like protein